MVQPSRARDKDLAIAFGQRLKKLRTEAGLTQERLAHETGLHPTYISNLERGRSAPTLYAIVRVADGLELDAGELVAGLGGRSEGA